MNILYFVKLFDCRFCHIGTFVGDDNKGY